MKRWGGQPRNPFDGGERDEDDRLVIRMGDACPECGNGPDVKYSGDGNLVMYHTPVACQGHVRNWRARFESQKQRELEVSA